LSAGLSKPGGGGTSTERLKTGAEQVLAVSHILGAPSFRSTGPGHSFAHSPSRRFAVSPIRSFPGCVSGW